ncbi:uncharacterized protein LTR77_000025 [Saxophila tyrrhenica]|uniref:Uncharacterized protein n=1 Tax=Saxophila tyrrhenica TaxID=1690608 RepID=A0AAV9PLK3_9PEZI|nr:hypothetical protein LTR77_000025 [Saxophila tyrrhenica]
MSTSHQSTEPYTKAEKDWLKQKFDGEFKFLQTQGLSIYKEEDREEGRTIARALRANDDEDDEEEEEEKEENQFLKDLEEDPMSHLADHHFSEKQLEWIEKHYRHSGNFMFSHVLKAFDDEDCEEAVAMVAAFMED